MFKVLNWILYLFFFRFHICRASDSPYIPDYLWIKVKTEHLIATPQTADWAVREAAPNAPVTNATPVYCLLVSLPTSPSSARAGAATATRACRNHKIAHPNSSRAAVVPPFPAFYLIRAGLS